MEKAESDKDSADEGLSAEEQAEVKAESEQAVERAKSGGGADPSMARQPETLIKGANSAVQHKTVARPVDRDTLPKDALVKQVFHEERVRYDLSMTLTRLLIDVEKLAISTQSGDTLVSADMDEFGPPKMRVT